jgi:hypothetical protein
MKAEEWLVGFFCPYSFVESHRGFGSVMVFDADGTADLTLIRR